MTIELEAKFVRGRGSVDEYLTQTAIANPHVTLHYVDPDGNQRDFARSAKVLPPEPKEIKPHPYGVELGRLAAMLQEDAGETIAQFLTTKFSRVSSGVARKICDDGQGLDPREHAQDGPQGSRGALPGDSRHADRRRRRPIAFRRSARS